MLFVDIGFSNYVEVGKILTVNRPDSSPIKRMIQQAKDSNRFLDLTARQKTRSIITLKSLRMESLLQHLLFRQLQFIERETFNKT
ncbi:DUF370 domain-containing protein [Priestia megaterium]|uniref:DUF370 domain-containing protein n=1 Tax=Priestia megaterium TaxID=1404 RepID=UPI001CB8984C|nr:DUF370 domain-containing protein [Priestia megaterium]